MLIFLVFLILLVLLIGSSAVLSAALGVIGWIAAAIATLAFVVWFSTTFDIDPGLTILGVVLGIPGGLFVLVWTLFQIENRQKPAKDRITFGDFCKQHQK